MKRVIAAGLMLMALFASAQPFMPEPLLRPRQFRNLGAERTSRLGQADYAYFEFAPADGAGMGSVCAGTVPTGAKGEVMTFTRATNATCTKTASSGLATTGIANGDLVVLSSNQPRVEYDSQGVLGLLVESSRTNSDLRSEEIDNAWWSDVATGAANPTLNGTCANSPLASPTSTPEDYTFPATTAGQQSGRLGTVIAGLAAVASTHSFYVCGVGGAGSMDICVWNTTTPTCSTCDFPACSSNTWNRCTRTATSSGNVATFIGNNTLYNGGTSRSSNRVCVTGAQAEAGSYATSYIPTTSAAATRNAETGSFALPVAMNAASGSHAASFQAPAIASVVVNLVRYQTAAQPLYVYPSSQFVRSYDGTTEITNNTPALSVGTVYRVSSTYSGSTQTATDWVPDTTSGAFDGQMGTTALSTVTVCGLEGSQASFLCSRICADPDPTRCR